MTHWNSYPEVTPPEKVPLWVTFEDHKGGRFVGEVFYEKSVGFYDDFGGTDEIGQVVAFVVLPGPLK